MHKHSCLLKPIIADEDKCGFCPQVELKLFHGMQCPHNQCFAHQTLKTSLPYAKSLPLITTKMVAATYPTPSPVLLP